MGSTVQDHENMDIQPPENSGIKTVCNNEPNDTNEISNDASETCDSSKCCIDKLVKAECCFKQTSDLQIDCIGNSIAMQINSSNDDSISLNECTTKAEIVENDNIMVDLSVNIPDTNFNSVKHKIKVKKICRDKVCKTNADGESVSPDSTENVTKLGNDDDCNVYSSSEFDDDGMPDIQHGSDSLVNPSFSIVTNEENNSAVNSITPNADNVLDLSASSNSRDPQSADTSGQSSFAERAVRRRWFFGLLADSSDHSADEEQSRDSDTNISKVEPAEDGDSVYNTEDLDKFLPHDTWKPLQELYNRERCFRPQSCNAFKRKCVGSVNLVRRLELKKKLEKHEGCVNALHFNKSGTLLASGSDDLNVVLWDWQRGRPYLVFDSGHRANVFQVKFVPYTGDTHLVTCARDGQVRLAELSVTGVCKTTKKLLQHRGAAHKLALQEDTSHLFYSCGEDGLVYEIDLRHEKPNKLVVVKQESRIPLYSIHCHPFKSEEFCVGGRDQFVRVYDKRMIGEQEETNSGLVKKFCPELLVSSDSKANVTCAVYNHDGSEILASYNDEDIYLFDSSHSDGASHIHRYHGHRNNATVKGVNFYGQHSEFIVSGSDCSNVFLWEKQSEKIVQYFHADDGGVVNVLEPHPEMAVLATSGLDHDVKIWEPTAAEPSKLKGIASQIKRNLNDRQDDRANNAIDMFDTQLLWFLMRHLRRRERQSRHAEGEGEDTDDATSSSSDSDDSDSSDDNSAGPWNNWFPVS